MLPELRARFDRRHLLAGALCLFGAVLLAMPLCASAQFALPLAVLGGVAWSAMITTLNSTAQSSFPSELRARTLSVYLMALALGQTVGSLFWGRLAALAGVPHALMLAGTALLLYALHVLRAPPGMRF